MKFMGSSRTDPGTPGMWKIISGALPLGIANLSVVALTVTDVVMLGQVGTFELASGVLAMQIYAILLVFGEGLVMGFGPNYGRDASAGRFERLPGLIRAAMFCVLLLGGFSLLVMALGPEILLILQQEQALALHARSYMLLIGAAVIPNLLFLLFWEILLYNDSSRLVLVGSIIQVLVNAAGNYLLIYGKFGFPELGLAGAGISTLVSAMAGSAVLAWYCLRDGFLSMRDLTSVRASETARPLVALLRLGVPFGLTLISTMAFLSAATYLMGLYGEDAIAAHAVAFQVNEIIIIFLLGFGEYAALLLSTNLGGQSNRDIRKTCLRVCTAALLVLLAMIVPAYLFRDHIVGMVLAIGSAQNAEAVRLSIRIISLSLPFVILSALIIVLQGILRGLHSTSVPFVLILVGYWGCGFPAQVWLMQNYPDNPLAIWWGMPIGFGIALCLLLAHLVLLLRGMTMLRFSGDLP